MLHIFGLAQSGGVHPSRRRSMEEQVNEDRVKTFIELTRQALEEDRIGQPDLHYRPKLTFNYPRPGTRREGKGLRRKD
jgi:hypothetical protein